MGTGTDQPIQAMRVLGDRHDPFIADGDGLKEESSEGLHVDIVSFTGFSVVITLSEAFAKRA